MRKQTILREKGPPSIDLWFDDLRVYNLKSELSFKAKEHHFTGISFINPRTCTCLISHPRQRCVNVALFRRGFSRVKWGFSAHRKVLNAKGGLRWLCGKRASINFGIDIRHFNHFNGLEGRTCRSNLRSRQDLGFDPSLIFRTDRRPKSKSSSEQTKPSYNDQSSSCDPVL